MIFSFFILVEKGTGTVKYIIDEKECDDTQAVDLSAYKSYLLIPEKFVLVEHAVELTVKVSEDLPPQTFRTTRYRVKGHYAQHKQTYIKGLDSDRILITKKTFFGLIVPSGRVKQVELFKVDKNEKSIYLYSLQQIQDSLSFVTVKNL